jgi:hypothetical protein
VGDARPDFAWRSNVTEPKEKETPAGVGPGVTGASGDFIDGTGGQAGVGGTGQDNADDAAGMRPDERNAPRPTGGEGQTSASAARPTGSGTGNIGGGGPASDPVEGAGPGRPGGGGSGAPGDVPGGIRNVTPANDRVEDADHVHSGNERADRAPLPRAGNPGTDE